jgi:hypothetical protein
LKALSIKQPWVIRCEGKDIDNRSWQRDFRGRIDEAPTVETTFKD